MPRPLKFVITVMLLSILIVAGSLFWKFVCQEQVELKEFSAKTIGIFIQIIVLSGLFQRARWAWTAARILTFLGIILQILIFILLLSVMHDAPVYALIKVISGGIGLALGFSIFWALGRPSVRMYFRRRSDF